MPKETNVQQLSTAYYQAQQSRQRADVAFDAWQQSAQSAGQTGYMAFAAAKKSAGYALDAAYAQAAQMRISASVAGITADSIYDVGQQNLQRDRTMMYQRVGGQKIAVAAGGLSFAGSPSLLIRETIDQSLAEQKANFLSTAREEARFRQEQQNQVRQAAVTEQVGRFNYNESIKLAGDQWHQVGVRAAGG